MTNCVGNFAGICFVPVSTSASLFGFADFIAALALLIIIYTISDIRYRFRVAVSPIHLPRFSYGFIIFIGFSTLATDVWIAERWLVPDSILTAAVWQAILATLFLGLVLTWMWYAFIKPRTFGRDNYESYSRELFRIVMKGSDAELPIIAHELAFSAKSLVTLAVGSQKLESEAGGSRKPTAEAYANDVLLLIANRKFCRHIVASSPATAIRLFDAVAERKAFDIPIGLFAQNVSAEALQNKDSSLYHEDEGYSSGLLGYIKPFSYALYGNYELVSSFDFKSPLDIDYKVRNTWDADQFEAYCRVAHMTLSSYLHDGHWGRPFYVLTRALEVMTEAVYRAVHEVRRGDDYDMDAWRRLHEGVGFIKDSIDAIEKMNPVPAARTWRYRNNDFTREDLYDVLADAMFEMVYFASHVNGPPEQAWSIHHNAVWSRFFGLGCTGSAWKVMQFKLRRLLYNEIRDLESLPNYKAAHVLGICLNVIGLDARKQPTHRRGETALRLAVLAWTRKNYLRLRQFNVDIAEACLIGGITFDAEQCRLVKTFAKGLNLEAPRQFLTLQPLPSSCD